jgi:hypothetical protein
MTGVFMDLLRKAKSNGSPKQRKLRTLEKNGDNAVELNALTLGALVVAFVAGGLIGWFSRQPKTVTVAPPDLEREKTLAEAKHQVLMDDIDTHLAATKDALIQLANRQETLAAELRGEQTPIEVQPEPNEQDAIAPPRDYADARGQLQ